VGLYSQSTNHASVKVATLFGSLRFWAHQGDEIGFDAGFCGVNPKPNQLQLKRGMAAVGEDVGVVRV